jgi:hypothetical protein
MAQSIEQINQALRTLEAQANELGERLYGIYQGYRTAVGQTAMQQLVMACFTLCTEAYPEEFLALEVYQRNQLQGKIRQFAKQLQTDLIEKLPHPQAEIAAPPSLESLLPALNMPDDLRSVGDHRTLEAPSEAGQEIIDSINEEADEEDDKRHRLDAESLNLEEELRALLSLEALLPKSAKANRPKTPIEKLMIWQETVEGTTQELMRQTSKTLNLEFQKSGLMPAQIPAPILEAAAYTDGGDPFGKTPHLLRMVLEAREVHRDDGSKPDAKRRRREDSKRSNKPPTIVPIVAVQLRLSELEFNDTSLISWRNQIRDLTKQLKTVAKEYQKKQKEQAVANARLAWQSTWTNE